MKFKEIVYRYFNSLRNLLKWGSILGITLIVFCMLAIFATYLMTRAFIS